MLGIYFAWPQIPSIMSIVYFLHLTARGLAFFFCVSVAKNKITIVAWALRLHQWRITMLNNHCAQYAVSIQ